jgi:predicted RNA binding protein YcfA (HicA-like mRNA interferase family)
MCFITFSRKMGTNGHEIARRVADQLGYKLYDTEAIENAAREMGFLKDVRKIDEKVPSLFERLFSHRPEMHLDRLHSVIYELASRGNAVFLGRGSHILLRAFKCALHIRVTVLLHQWNPVRTEGSHIRTMHISLGNRYPLGLLRLKSSGWSR